METSELKPPPIPEDAVLRTDDGDEEKEETEDPFHVLPSYGTDDSFACPDAIKIMIRDTIDKEVKRAVDDALKSQELVHNKRIEDLKDDYEEKLADQLVASNTERDAEIEKIRQEYAIKMKVIEQDARNALESMRNGLERDHEERISAERQRLEKKYRTQISAIEERALFQQQKAIRKMAEQCDLQIKSVRDWADKDKKLAVDALNKKWSAFVEEQQNHLRLDQNIHMSAFQDKCQSEINAFAKVRDDAVAHAKKLEQQLQRTYRVLQETAASREMARVDNPLSLKRFIRAQKVPETVGSYSPFSTSSGTSVEPPPIPIASPAKTGASLSPVVSASRHMSETKCPPPPLDEGLLSDLGYSNPTSLVDTITPETRHALVTPKTFFKTAKPRYLGVLRH